MAPTPTQPTPSQGAATQSETPTDAATQDTAAAAPGAPTEAPTTLAADDDAPGEPSASIPVESDGGVPASTVAGMVLAVGVGAGAAGVAWRRRARST